ncbi:MAG: hypothetical protein ACI9KE_001366 [Polyangiales bacterium]|jgi:hypothetical protein
MSTLADLLISGDQDAQAQLDAVCVEFGVRLVPDHEGALLRGAFVQRRRVPPSQYLELARSWEQFDRAFAPAEAATHTFAMGQLEGFVKSTGIAGDLGDHILFVVEREGAPDVLISLGDDAWDEWLASIQRGRVDGHAAASLLREYLQRDPHPHARSQEQGPIGR